MGLTYIIQIPEIFHKCHHSKYGLLSSMQGMLPLDFEKLVDSYVYTTALPAVTEEDREALEDVVADSEVELLNHSC